MSPFRLSVWSLAVACAASSVRADDEKPLSPRELQKKLMELIRDRQADPAEIQKIVDEMNRQAAERFQKPLGNMQLQIQGLPGFAPAVPAKPALREQYEKRLKEFDKEIADSANNPEAVAALKKAREAYVAAMADELKKADEEAKKNLRAPMPLFPKIDFAGPLLPARPTRPSRLGIGVEKPSAALVEQLDLPANAGVVVVSVAPGSVAEKAGLKQNDIVLKLAGQDVPNEPAVFAEVVAKLKAGEKFDAEILRKGKKEMVKGIELPQDRRGGQQQQQGGGNQTQIQINNGDVQIGATADGVKFDIAGKLEDGKVVPTKIVIDEKEYDSLDKVPEEHRNAVKKLLAQVKPFGRR